MTSLTNLKWEHQSLAHLVALYKSGLEDTINRSHGIILNLASQIRTANEDRISDVEDYERLTQEILSLRTNMAALERDNRSNCLTIAWLKARIFELGCGENADNVHRNQETRSSFFRGYRSEVDATFHESTSLSQSFSNFPANKSDASHVLIRQRPQNTHTARGLSSWSIPYGGEVTPSQTSVTTHTLPYRTPHLDRSLNPAFSSPPSNHQENTYARPFRAPTRSDSTIHLNRTLNDRLLTAFQAEFRKKIVPGIILLK